MSEAGSLDTTCDCPVEGYRPHFSPDCPIASHRVAAEDAVQSRIAYARAQLPGRSRMSTCHFEEVDQ